MCAYIERENVKLGGVTPYVIEEKPVWRQEQQRTFGKTLGVAEHYAKDSGKHISTEWYPFYQVYVHESEASQPIPSPINSIRDSSCECSRGRDAGYVCG